ncbi:MAG: aminotransferase class V-fold PLP-dependent enzyme [Bacteroidetes bacterium]|nr:aminotransferase class V-fold PLP-dependent enzyme [Bacteroidota bacterium]
MNLESYFSKFRKNIVGINQTFSSPFGAQKLVYADWTASGRLYEPIERRLLESFGPFVGNTHSESTITGGLMTHAYHHAHEIIKKHVHAGDDDVLLFVGSGMTTAINKFQRILGVKVPDRYKNSFSIPEDERPVVFVTHMEHHSNQTTWYETEVDVHIIAADGSGYVDINDLSAALKKYEKRILKIGSFSACSNVTGITTPYHQLAEIMHEYGGIAVIDFAASAPYVSIDMHPADEKQKLDAIIFSPHKFLGGPGTSGVLIFNKNLYHLESPDQPGGGTVLWTNPWGKHRFSPDIEVREDGGTPGFLQAIKASLAVQLKEEMQVEKILAREHEISTTFFEQLQSIPRLTILAGNIKHRLSIFSFYFEHIHYNLVVKLLNDKYGIQSRGGCSCAGTYGHYLLHVDEKHSQSITDKIDSGDLSEKPGWVRISFHPTTTNEEIMYIADALRQIEKNIFVWQNDYAYNNQSNEYFHKNENGILSAMAQQWFAF